MNEVNKKNIEEYGIHFVIYGLSGCGKSSLIHTIPCVAENIAVIACEVKDVKLFREKPYKVRKVFGGEKSGFDSFVEFFNKAESSQNIEWIFVDGLEKLMDNLMSEARKRESSASKATNIFNVQMSDVLNLLVASKKKLVITSGIEYIKEGAHYRCRQDSSYRPSDTSITGMFNNVFAMIKINRDNRELIIQDIREYETRVEYSAELMEKEQADIGKLMKKIIGE